MGVLDDKVVKVGGLEAMRLIYDAEPNGKPMRMVQYISITNGSSYTFLFFSARDRGEKLAAVAQPIVASFKPAK